MWTWCHWAKASYDLRGLGGHEVQHWWFPQLPRSRRALMMHRGGHWIMQLPGHGFLGCCSTSSIFTLHLQ